MRLQTHHQTNTGINLNLHSHTPWDRLLDIRSKPGSHAVVFQIVYFQDSPYEIKQVQNIHQLMKFTTKTLQLK